MREVRNGMRIGIPRALTFYRYYPFLKVFLEGCGQEVFSSPPTDMRILEAGAEACVDDVCVAVKVLFGHVRFLEGEADALLLPRPVSVERRHHDTFTCPKLIAAPDMIRFFRERPPLLLEWVLNAAEAPWWWGCALLAARLRVSPWRARKAYREACRAQGVFEYLLRQGLFPDEALDIWENMVDNRRRHRSMGEESASADETGVEPYIRAGVTCAKGLSSAVGAAADRNGWKAGEPGDMNRFAVAKPRIAFLSDEGMLMEGRASQAGSASQDRDEVRQWDLGRERVTVGVVGHPYLLADRLVNKSLIRWLEEAGAQAWPCTMLSPEVLERESRRVPVTSWSYERELLAATSHFVRRPEVQGVVYLTSFGCGPDSLTVEMARREITSRCGKPLLEVVLDEHTGDAAVRTRAEAFVDMILRQKPVEGRRRATSAQGHGRRRGASSPSRFLISPGS